jgi:hypothetical protein
VCSRKIIQGAYLVQNKFYRTRMHPDAVQRTRILPGDVLYNRSRRCRVDKLTNLFLPLLLFLELFAFYFL